MLVVGGMDTNNAWVYLLMGIFVHSLASQDSSNSTITINIDNSTAQLLNPSQSVCKCIKYFGKKLKECMNTLSDEEKKQNFIAMTVPAQIDYIKSLTLKEHLTFAPLFCDDNGVMYAKDGPIQQGFCNHLVFLKKVIDRNFILSPNNTYWCALFYFSIFPARECNAAEWLKMLEEDYQQEKKKYYENRSTL
ncbi:hypothetical protein Noda2021_01940 [Candidatus Dependentiae bacterium Noda2021]|nr:hypothetical protein Noda2021_01940 [Candidatus Dependentiae bacterium Noda2021]